MAAPTAATTAATTSDASDSWDAFHRLDDTDIVNSLNAADPNWLPDTLALPDRLQGNLMHRVVLPLQQAGVMLGALIVGREDRDWSAQEYHQLEETAHSLTLACLMDRRFTWLQAKYHQQEIAQERQQDLLDTLLHQIRNPLTAVRTFSKLLLRRLHPDSPNQQITRNIIRESDRLGDLLQQLDESMTTALESQPAALPPVAATPDSSNNSTDIATIETTAIRPDLESPEPPADAGKRLADPTGQTRQMLSPWLTNLAELQPIDLQEILSPLLESAEALALDQGLSLHIMWPTDPLPSLRANPQALQEIVNNLIDNAIKYTPSGGAIGVMITREPHWVVVSISDSGPGIPGQDLPQLFERHYRGIQAHSDIPGTGLGLAIARELVEQMRGRLTVASPAGPWHPQPDSEPQAPGSVFQVWLPTSASA
jgi:signal transduction histidine kinase